jgi:DNA-binding CsgD family transcriptional regulator
MKREAIVLDTQEANGTVGISPSGLLVAALGLSFTLTVGMVELNPSLYATPITGTYELISAAGPWRKAVTIALVAMLVVYSCKRGALLRRRRIAVIFAAVYTVGLALLYASGWGSQLFVPGVICSYLLMGVSIPLFIVWCEFCCSLGVWKMLVVIASAYAISFASSLLLSSMGFWAFVIVLTLLPLASAALLLTVHGEVDIDRYTVPLHALSDQPLKIFAGIGIYGFVLLLANDISEASTTVSTEVYTLIAGVLICAAIAILALAVKQRFNIILSYRIISAAMVIAFLIVMVAEPGNQQYEAVLLGGSWAFFRIITTALWCMLAQNSTLPAVAVVGTGQLFLSVLNELERPAFGMMQAAGLSSMYMIFIVIVLVVLTSTFLLSEQTLSRLLHKSQTDDMRRSAGELLDEAVTLSAERFGLSQREQEIARMVLDGKSSSEIQGTLFIAPGTYKAHMRNIYAKTDVHSKQEMVALLRSQTP